MNIHKRTRLTLLDRQERKSGDFIKSGRGKWLSCGTLLRHPANDLRCTETYQTSEIYSA